MECSGNQYKLSVIFPYGDVTLIKAIKLIYGEDSLVEDVISKWSPYKTYACRVLWQWVDKGMININTNQKCYNHFDDSFQCYQKAMLQFMNDYQMRFHVTKSVWDVLSIKNSLSCQCVIVANRHFLLLVHLRNPHIPNFFIPYTN